MIWRGWYGVVRSPIPAWVRHDSMALWPFVLDANGKLHPDVLAHEVQHLRQQLVVASLAAVLVLLLPVSHWWFLAVHPLPFALLYGTSYLVKGWRRSWFERNAGLQGDE